MRDFFEKLFQTDFMPHGFCLRWSPSVLWLTVISDSMIALAYVLIPIGLIYFVRRRRDLSFNWIFYLFAAFVLLCGATHAMSVYTLWHPIYRLEALLKMATGLVSLATSLSLFRLLPSMLAYPSPHDLADANARLEGLNTELENRIEQRTRDLAVARDEALNANRAKSLFLAMMSHEIRTPLNGILGTVTLLEDTRLTSEQRQHIATLRLSGNALLNVINDILDFSKIEADQLVMEDADFDVRRVVEEAIEVVAPTIDPKPIVLETSLAEDLPRVLKGDAGRLRQVLLNLLMNAVKFTDHGGIRCSGTLVELRDGRARLRFEVTDTGIGIGPQARGKLFQAFTQAELSTTRRYGGSGLGLTICKRLVGMMGGEIGFDSEVGSGSKFWFTVELPVSQAEALMPTAEDSLRGKRLLVVSHSAPDREVLRKLLAPMAREVVEAASGPEALQLVLDSCRSSDGPLHAAVIEEDLPQMGGLLLARAIRGQVGARRMPIVFVSSAAPRPARSLDALEELGPVVLRADVASSLRNSVVGVLNRDASDDGPERPTNKVAEGHRILLAEDNLVNQRVARLLLERLGAEVDIASNGHEAVIAAQARKYSLILMDCLMPEMDGYEATRQIREWEHQTSGPRTPIAALTASIMVGAAEQCRDAGMDDFMGKPMSHHDLKAMLERHLIRTTT